MSVERAENSGVAACKYRHVGMLESKALRPFTNQGLTGGTRNTERSCENMVTKKSPLRRVIFWCDILATSSYGALKPA